MQVDDPTMGLYYIDDDTKPTLFLNAKGADPTTYTKKKMVYVFLKTNIDPKAIFRDRYNIEYTRVSKEVVSTYYFGGLPLYNAIGQVRMLVPKLSIQSLPRDTSRKTLSGNGRDPTPTSYGVPLPTSTQK